MTTALTFVALSALSAGTRAATPAPSGPQPAAMLDVLSGLPAVPAVLVAVYLLARLLIPVLLILHTTRRATTKQRIDVLRDYLRATANRRNKR